MRLGTLRGRPVSIVGDSAADLRSASNGQYPTMAMVLQNWDSFLEWAEHTHPEYSPFDPADLEAPIPHPGQVVGVGLNYVSHLREAGRPTSRGEIVPLVFTKFPSSLTGPTSTILLHSLSVDWEVELVAVIGRRADSCTVVDALGHVAGYMVGQDLSDRLVQRSGQLSLGKSFRTYAPTGPWMVTADDVADPHDLLMSCWVNDELMQDISTNDMLYTIPELIAMLSAILPLNPGDLVFTGTGAGVGVFRQPPRFLQPGDVLRSSIEGIGEIRNVCVKAPEPADELARIWHLPPQVAR